MPSLTYSTGSLVGRSNMMKDPRFHFGRLGNSLFQYSFIYAQCRKGIIPDIFVQDVSYFDEYREEIRQLFNPNPSEPLPYVAVHLRVGKNPLNPNEPAYLKNPYYVALPETDYYEKAIAHFPNEKFLVFSDDPIFAKNYFIGDEYEFDETKDDLECLNRMSRCIGHITANSSYSFWGAYLSPYSKKVIAPKDWFSDGVQRVKVPDDWIKI